jgi:lysophospholipase L1-like esterase
MPVPKNKMKKSTIIRLIYGILLVGAYGLGLLTYRNNLPPLSFYRNANTTPLNIFTNVQSRTPVACPIAGERTMVILALGQSNSANRSAPSEPDYESIPTVVNFYEGKCYKIKGPILGATTDGNVPPHGNAVWPMVGEEIIRIGRADTVVIAPFAVGGTSIKQWTDDPIFTSTLAQRLIALKAANLIPTYITWFQGENDSQAKTSQSEYTKSFHRLLELIRQQDVRAPVFVSQTTMCADMVESPELRQAQSQLVDAKLNIRRGPDTDALGLAFRFDGCHFTYAGRQALAKAWATSITAP